MTPSITFVFSGQGSQHYRMAYALFECQPIFRRWMMRLDGMVQDLGGASVLDELYCPGRREGDRFDRTLLTHPAIFMVEYSLARALIERGVVPDAVVGASLGSFAAAAVAGFLDVADALAGVLRQAAAFEELCQPGAMAAILAPVDLQHSEVLRQSSELAAVNLSSHFVVSAPLVQLEAVEAHLRRSSVSYQRLPVSHAFHSRWIDPARDSFDSFMRPIRLGHGHLPFVCCENAATLTRLPAEHFWNVVRRPIRLRDAIEHLERGHAHRYVDVGPAGTFATFLKYGMPPTSASTVHPILSPYGRDQLRLDEVCTRLSR